MEHPPGFEKVISSLNNVVWTSDFSVEDAKKVSGDLDCLLTAEDGVRLLKHQTRHVEAVLPLFIRTIFHPDPNVAQPCLKHSDLILDIFRCALPKIKPSYKEFEKTTLLGLVESLKARVESNDELWPSVWVFVCNLITCDNLQAASLNKLLHVTEIAYKNKTKDRADVIEKAWICWKGLIKAFDRNPKCINIHKTINLLLRPLLNLSSSSKSQVSTWICLIESKGLISSEELVKSIVGSMCKMTYKSGDKSLSRNLPDDCIDAFVKILGHDNVTLCCLPDVIDIFGPCVNSRPSAGLIEQFAGILISLINTTKDDVESYKLWKALLEQYDACAESPILTQACRSIFTDVNFSRWVESSVLEGKDIIVLMSNAELRDKVLLRSIKTLTIDEQVDTPKKKSRKGSWEDVWSNYCEAYISWWSNQPPPSPKENDKTDQYLKDTDYQVAQCLLLQPVQSNLWNPTIGKTWSLLCAACDKQNFLLTCVKLIFDSVCEHFVIQKAIDVTDCLFKLDQNFCKQSTKVLDSISSAISSMEFQSLLDVLNLLETAVLHPEMSSVLGKICKTAIDKSSDYDQLIAHKIRTKVTKITRKLEILSNSTEKEKPVKAQRTCFRAQSNFLQRLAKAEEKNKTKSPFLSSMITSEKVKNSTENGEQEERDTESPCVNGDNTLDESDILPVTLPSMLKASPVMNGHSDDIVTLKEISLPPVNAHSPKPSPKIKITNAREVKTVDASSPASAKKHKPIAGLKTTPKKLTPSKVSYFDDDANDCVMVPPKPKTTPLTEHQMEMMSKRRSDIPALYQDLSQDTQSQQVVDVQVTPGVSPKQDSQDIVPGTPSPEEPSTPELKKSVGKSASSAKKLNFNDLCTPPKTSKMDESIRELSPVPEPNKEEDGMRISNGVASPLCDAKSDKPIEDPTSSKEPLSEPKEEVKHAIQPEEKAKRKRKSDPSKFSPKLTRSKKNLKNTPDAKFAKSDSKAPSKANYPEPAKPNSPEPKTEISKDNLQTPEPTNSVAANTGDEVQSEKTPEVSSQFDVLPSSQNPSKLELSEDKKKSRKRKILETTNDTPKKLKTSEEEPSKDKKVDSAKKKKKPFKLGAGGNLESWLVKTERVVAPVESEVTTEKLECNGNAPKSDSNESNGIDLNSSEEIVPSTQDCVENHKPVLVVEKPEEVVVKMEEEDPVPADADCSSPDNPEGSVLERLSHETPNDEVYLPISPSKRQRRATSVFRGEGDTYLGKEFFSSEESEEESKSKTKCKIASPTSKKRLQPLGGRSAKMLRLATSSSSTQDDEVVVTPSRRRESIAPVKYGENWPKGLMEEWVACTPSPFKSPFRSALRKTPVPEENTTPQRGRSDSMSSPLLSSAKRKRVVFLDPPVTRGLLYDLNSPGGSIHHADVPQGSPYPTWKSEEDANKMEFSPSKRDVERLNSLAEPSKDFQDSLLKIPQPPPSDVSDEVRQLIDPLEIANVPNPEPNIGELREKFNLSEEFIIQFSKTDTRLQSLLMQCFQCSNISKTVGTWKFEDCLLINQMPFSFLTSIKNLKGEVITDAFNQLNHRPNSTDSSSQTELQTRETHSQTPLLPTKHTSSQTTVIKSRTVETTTGVASATAATQADLHRLPTTDELASIVEKITPAQFGKFITNFSKIWTESLSKTK